MTLIICSLARLPDVIADKRPSHVMSLLSPDLMIEPLAHLPSERHLRLTVHDIHEPTPGMIAPDEAMVASLLRFGRGWDAERPMVVHCLAGVSRSSAAALAIACDRNPAVAEIEIALRLRALGAHIFPNRRITALADAMLERDGRLIAAVEAMGGDDLEAEHSPVELPSDYAAPVGS
jgi:predicted protein tyrosine phosphatase